MHAVLQGCLQSYANTLVVAQCPVAVIQLRSSWRIVNPRTNLLHAFLVKLHREF